MRRPWPLIQMLFIAGMLRLRNIFQQVNHLANRSEY